MRQTVAMKRLRREIAMRERRFKKMSRAEKRVAIAKDVIAALDARRITAETGVWADIKLSADAVTAISDVGSKPLRAVIVESAPKCSACAMGAMFVCAVERQEANVEVDNDAVYTVDNFRVEVQFDEVVAHLKKFFSVAQLKLIEIAFERDGGWFQAEDAQGERARKFANGVPRRRMRAIMRNIIDNDGTFCP